MTCDDDDSESVWLYRIYDEDWLLLYIGITDDFGRRWSQHMRRQPWWPEVRHLTVDLHPSRDDAEREETSAIKAEMPRHNKLHSLVEPEFVLDEATEPYLVAAFAEIATWPRQ